MAISELEGMGKTQLNLYFARQHHQRYSAVIWLNVSSEVTLKATYVSFAQRIRHHNKQREAESNEMIKQLKEEQAIQLIRQWLFQAKNKTWLLMFDNYDDSQLLNIHSSIEYDVRTFFLYFTQKSILITIRFFRIIFAKSMRLNKFDDFNQSLTILTKRSNRQAQKDKYIRSLKINIDFAFNDFCC